jgi:hypothetical protein
MRIVLYILAALIGIILLLQTLGIPIIEVGQTVEIGEGDEEIILSLSGFSEWREGRILVYFKLPQQALAQEVAKALQDSLQLISERLGIEGSLAVALFQKEEIGDITSKSFTLPGDVWPIFVSQTWESLQDGDLYFQQRIYWVMPHEATEGVIARLLYLDRRARWIGDGLAEYAGYITSRERAPAVVHNRLIDDLMGRVETLLNGGKATYNLTKDFPVRSGLAGQPDLPWTEVERAGYSVALAFWLEVAQRHGEGTIRTFWKKFEALPRVCITFFCIGPGAQDAARILGELTGEDIWVKLQQMDLQEVLQTLEQAAQMSATP